MEASHHSIQRNSQNCLYPNEERSISVFGRITIAIGIIVLLGSLVANGCLFAQLSNYSFAIGACGFALGILLIVLASCICRTSLEAGVQEQEKARTNGPFDPNRFRADADYRIERLRNNNWFSNDSAKNKDLIDCIQDSEFRHVQYEQLPETVKKDFYEALMKGDVNKAQNFFSDKLSSSVIEMMEERHIRIIYGRDVAILASATRTQKKS